MTSQADGVLCEQKMLEVIILIADIALIVTLAVMTRQVYRALKRHRPPKYTSSMGIDTDLPSVTVCIPARNEQHALTNCLQRVIASTYEKLEIIVLDDVSGDDTSALIKSFASEGVRFVKGKALPPGWLGKNHALQGLLEEASGSYILFVDVDTVLAPQAVEHMVRYAISHRASMVSVLPRREDGWRMSVIASPLRYFWEILFSRRLQPAAASSAWLIRRDVLLRKFDGFKTLKVAVQPESKIAAELAQTNEYRFLVGTNAFGIAYEKKWRSQLITSIRLLYPFFGSQGALVIIVLLDLILFMVPTAVIVSVWLGAFVSAPLLILNVALWVGFAMLYGLYTKSVWNHGWLIATLLWPLLILQEIILVIVSLIQYERRTVTWKGRLIRPEVQN